MPLTHTAHACSAAAWWRRAALVLLLAIGIAVVHAHVRAPDGVADLTAAALLDPAAPEAFDTSEPGSPEQAFDVEIIQRRADPVPAPARPVVAGGRVDFRSCTSPPHERPPRIDRARA